MAISSSSKKFQKFQKKVWASCSIAKGCLRSEAQLKWIGDSHQAVWESDYKVIKTEWELTLKEDCHSFEINKKMDRTRQLLQIKEAMYLKIHPCESEAGILGRKKTLVQSLKQYYAYFYWLYIKNTTCDMVSLQGLHSGEAFRCPSVSTSMGLKAFCPCCLKLGGNTETIFIHLQEVNYRMSIMCNIFQAFTGMSTQSILDHHLGARQNMTGNVQSMKGPQSP